MDINMVNIKYDLVAAGKDSSPEMSLRDKITVSIAELVGTALLVFVGCISCVNTLSSGSSSHEAISFSFGFAVMLVVQVRSLLETFYAIKNVETKSDLQEKS